MRPWPGVPAGGSIQSAPSDSHANWIDARFGTPSLVTAKSRKFGVDVSTRLGSGCRCAEEAGDNAATASAATEQKARAPLRAAEESRAFFNILGSVDCVRAPLRNPLLQQSASGAVSDGRTWRR